jgi:hypothetical protein
VSLVYYYTGRMGDLRDLLATHEADASRCSDHNALGLFLAWNGHAHTWSLEIERGDELLDRAWQIASTTTAPMLLAYASAWSTMALCMAGNAPEAVAMGERAVTLGRSVATDDLYPLVKATSMLAYAKTLQGDLSAARVMCEELITLGRDNDSARATALGYQGLAVVTGCLLDHPRAAALARQAVTAARDPLYEGLSTLWEASFDLEAGQIDAAADAADRLSRLWHGRSVELVETRREPSQQPCRSTTDNSRTEWTASWQNSTDAAPPDACGASGSSPSSSPTPTPRSPARK